MEEEVCYTDGSTPSNGFGATRGGVGVWFGEADPRNVGEPYPGDDAPTNQKCELYAILRALEVHNGPAGLLVRTDSRYAIGCLTEWCERWERNGWKNSKRQDVANAALIRRILGLMRAKESPVRFEHVRAHTGRRDANSIGNAMADALARQGAGFV